MKSTLVAVVSAAAFGVVGVWGPAASADEVARPKPKPVVVDTVKIVGRYRPGAAVDIARVRPQLGVRDLRRSPVDKIEQPTSKEPF